eukprot:CAMPEP_0174271790 /NCGR_PEP_ID=MMETSP0439-20130205/49089_1 /TAXON_ID=0 /ORGANISM="Stereomyxa ramosa, Strain Chinc5" /LENGTH=441 /DNA_ID=CAMNT_0015362009 /DNA_START=80 /DNA_END=1402 /DNA_ORIENTATION=+
MKDTTRRIRVTLSAIWVLVVAAVVVVKGAPYPGAYVRITEHDNALIKSCVDEVLGTEDPHNFCYLEAFRGEPLDCSDNPIIISKNVPGDFRSPAKYPVIEVFDFEFEFSGRHSEKVFNPPRGIFFGEEGQQSTSHYESDLVHTVQGVERIHFKKPVDSSTPWFVKQMSEYQSEYWSGGPKNCRSTPLVEAEFHLPLYRIGPYEEIVVHVEGVLGSYKLTSGGRRNFNAKKNNLNGFIEEISILPNCIRYNWVNSILPSAPPATEPVLLKNWDFWTRGFSLPYNGSDYKFPNISLPECADVDGLTSADSTGKLCSGCAYAGPQGELETCEYEGYVENILYGTNLHSGPQCVYTQDVSVCQLVDLTCTVCSGVQCPSDTPACCPGTVTPDFCCTQHQFKISRDAAEMEAEFQEKTVDNQRELRSTDEEVHRAALEAKNRLQQQ